ncbi:SH3 domain-containing protein [Thalassobaculum sp. OXR-137]|uniref:SH3 domain-containing protein n=1 Tax=Thalassobaculum sp. OXR-137 TaxID=3100173 RepID=UPI002AC9D7FB|nr:SH3 domain-containing protein [Thalassobaculum sp. OXR-137]WPZ35920.1 SH3 domain-containing protein [Thalassobaculum sp. OXR-137]
MRPRYTALALAGALALQPMAAAPVLAQDASNNSTLGISNKNIGRVLGGIGGALLGSQIGGGSGKMVAVAAGAIGGLFLGGEVADYLTERDQQGIADTSQQALNTGQTQTWTNPDTGTTTTAEVQQVTYRPAPTATATQDSSKLAWRVPTMQLVGADYAATTKTNVRGGPSTNYAIMDQLESGETVRVVGKVANENWYMISRNGIGKGFVFGDLLRRVDSGTYTAERPQSSATQVNARECSIITQRVETTNGRTETREAQACQRADGSWELV